MIKIKHKRETVCSACEYEICESPCPVSAVLKYTDFRALLALASAVDAWDRLCDTKEARYEDIDFGYGEIKRKLEKVRGIGK